jgi:hypothetical protein
MCYCMITRISVVDVGDDALTAYMGMRVIFFRTGTGRLRPRSAELMRPMEVFAGKGLGTSLPADNGTFDTGRDKGPGTHYRPLCEFSLGIFQ